MGNKKIAKSESQQNESWVTFLPHSSSAPAFHILSFFEQEDIYFCIPPEKKKMDEPLGVCELFVFKEKASPFFINLESIDQDSIVSGPAKMTFIKEIIYIGDVLITPLSPR